eukprot:Skav234113  [mRNA]  locus=scaffold4487:72486:73889:- [translate_table: standard]
MGCAAGTFERRCKNPSCAYVPSAAADGYCCSNCKKMHDGSLLWDVKILGTQMTIDVFGLLGMTWNGRCCF